MRILLINNQHHIIGGAQRVYFDTGHLLEKYGHDIFYYSMQDEKMLPYRHTNFFPLATDYRNISFMSKIKGVEKFIYNRDAFSNLLDFIDLIKPDVAHIHLFFGGLTTSILKALRKRNVPIVHTAHDFRLVCPAYLFIDGKNKICELCKDRIFLRCIIKRCSENNLQQSAMLALDAYYRQYILDPLDCIDRFIFVSRFSREKHIEFNSAYTYKSKTLYNFIPNLETVESSDLKGNYFLYYGRLSREKGVEALIDAASSLSIKLKIAGTGPLSDNISSKFFKDIDFLGYKTGEELWKLVRNASFIIVPSVCYENNPLTILEAYAHGKPVIGSNIGGIPELIDDGKTGFLFNPGNRKQLMEILSVADQMEMSKYRIMSQHALSFANENFNPQNYYKNLMEIYKEIQY